MRLIDADIFNLFDYSSFDGALTEDAIQGMETVLTQIDAAPIIDAVPVVHGRWILEREPNGKPYCFHCSVCDDDFHHISIKSATDYCPHCGAKMDEVNDNGT